MSDIADTAINREFMDGYTFDTEGGLPTIGDAVPDGATIVWEDSPERTVLLVRDGDRIKIISTMKTIRALFDANAREAASFNATGSLGTMSKVASIPTDLYWLWKRRVRLTTR